MLPRSNIFILILFIVITFPAYSALLKPGILTSHDGEGHIIRMFEFNNALEDGHFPARWSKRLNWGLGYPFFNFNYPLPYYLGFLMFKTGLDLLSIFKIFLIISFPLSSFFTYFWLKNHFGKIESFIGGLFYSLIPYHFVNVYVRGNIAETLAITIIPLNLYLVNYLKQKQNLFGITFLSLSLSFVILSHNISALLFLPVILIYGLLLNFKRKYWKLLIFSFVLPVFFTSFFWLPALLDKQLITIDQKFPLYYAKHFLKVTDLIYSPWGFGGSGVGPGQMSVQIGLLHIFIFICSLIVLMVNFKKVTQMKTGVFFIGLSLLAFLMMLNPSKLIWDTLKPIQYLQFPWRLLSILTLTSSFLSAFVFSYIFNNIPKKIVFIPFLITVIVISGLLFVNRNHWKANQYYSLPTYWFEDAPYGSTTTVDGEHTPKWQLEDMPSETSRYQVISGEAKVVSSVWKTNYHAFLVNAKSPVIMLDRTVFFPGWKVFIDGKQVKTINQYQPSTKGLIGFAVPKGQHKIEAKLLEPTEHQIANAISVFSILATAGLFINSAKRQGL